MIDTNGMVGEFIKAFDARPNWVDLVIEESKEVNEAAEHLLKEVCDLIYVAEGLTIAGGNPDNLIPNEHVNAAIKWIDAIIMLVPMDQRNEAFSRVHTSNMSKLVDGKPLRREDGKILKGPNYQPPSLTGLATLND